MTQAATNAASTVTNAHSYSVRGVVKELMSDGRSARIRHEEIPGYMPAMTMVFEVRDTLELQGVKLGDTVAFRMWVTEDDGWIDRVRVLDVAERTGAPTTGPFRLVREVEPLKVGDPLPDYGLTNQLGQPIRLSQFKGGVVAINFIFTRCPYPKFCPLMAKNFQEAQSRLSALTNAPLNWKLLTISFDPEYDTPTRLKTHAERYDCDPQRWSFCTGALMDVTALTEQFGMYFWKEAGAISHNLRTVVVDPAGRVHAVLKDNEWKPDELVAKMIEAGAKRGGGS